MSRVLGLDLGSHAVKAFLIESTFRGFEPKRYVEARVGEGGLKAALAALAAEKHLAADQVVVALPGVAAATHLLTLPFTDARRLEQTLPFEVEGVVPFELDEVAYDYQGVGVRDGKTDAFVGVVRREEVAALLALLAEFRVDPRIVTLGALAYQNLLPSAPGPGEAHAVVDVGHERTGVAILGAGGVEFARTFVGGGRDLTRALATDFKLDADAAERLKESSSVAPRTNDPDAERAASDLLRALSSIVREIRATLRSHAARRRVAVSRVHLTGGTARLRGLPELFARDLGVEVERLSALPLSAAALLPRESEPVASLSVALALRGHAGNRQARFNLRRGAFAFKGDFEVLKGKVARLGAFAAVLVLLAGVAGWARINTLSRREARLDDEVCKATQRVLGKCVRDFTVAISMFKGQGSAAAAIAQISALDLFAEFATRTPPDVAVKYEEIEVSGDRIRARGLAPNFEGVDKVVAALKAYRCFADIKRGRVQKKGDGSQVTFDVDIVVNCPEAGSPQG